VIAPSSGDDIEGAIAADTKLSERTREVGAPLEESVEAWHVAIPWPSGVVAYNPYGLANVAISAVLPAIHGGDLETSVLQHLKQPS
jgi:hypothetical protein